MGVKCYGYFEGKRPESNRRAMDLTDNWILSRNMLKTRGTTLSRSLKMKVYQALRTQKTGQHLKK